MATIPKFFGDWWERSSNHMRILLILLAFNGVSVIINLFLKKKATDPVIQQKVFALIGIVCAGYTIDGGYDIITMESYYSESISDNSLLDLKDSQGIIIDEQFWIRLLVWVMEIEAICFTIICFVGIYRSRKNILLMVRGNLDFSFPC